MTKNKKYNGEGIELVECFVCRNEVIISRAGRFRGNWYCDPDYLKRLEQQIHDWKVEFKRFRNGKSERLSQDEIMEAPKLSPYIN